MKNMTLVKAGGTDQRQRGKTSPQNSHLPSGDSNQVTLARQSPLLGNLSNVAAKLQGMGIGNATRQAFLDSADVPTRPSSPSSPNAPPVLGHALVRRSQAVGRDGQDEHEDDRIFEDISKAASTPLDLGNAPFSFPFRLTPSPLDTLPSSEHALVPYALLSHSAYDCDKEQDSSDSITEDISKSLVTPATSPDIEIPAPQKDLPDFMKQVLGLKTAGKGKEPTSKVSTPAQKVPSVDSEFMPFAGDGAHYRIWLSNELKKPLVSSAAWHFTLPWDEAGRYRCDYHHKKTKGSSDHRSEVNAFHYNDPELQIQIITALFDREYFEDEQLLKDPRTRDVARRPIHCFIDMSNINAGFHNHLSLQRYGRPDVHSRARLFFEGFLEAIVRKRRAAKRIVVGSYRDGSTSLPAFAKDARNSGCETSILQRVTRTQPPPSHKGGRQVKRADFGAGEEKYGFREQCVDEILHLKMLQSVVDYNQPATIVLATGDASEAEFSDGFYRQVQRVLDLGWHVEVAAFTCNMSSSWCSSYLPNKYPGQYRAVRLDRITEELIDSYLRTEPPNFAA